MKCHIIKLWNLYRVFPTRYNSECFNISTQYKNFNLSINSKADDDQEVPKGCDHNANLVIATDDDDGGADGGDIDNDGADYDNYLQLIMMVLI